MSSCKIVLENYNGGYSRGAEVKGRFECYFKMNVRVRYIKIRIECKERVEWTKFTTYSDPMERNFKWLYVTFFGEKIIYLHEEKIFGGDIGSKIIRKGKHNYPFFFTLPWDLPSSFKGKYGSVTYALKSTINQLIWSDFEDVVEINVLSPIEIINLPPSVSEIQSYHNEATIYCCCISLGLLKMKVKLPKLVFFPGETIEFMVKVRNLTNKKMKKLTVKFIKKIRFIATNPKAVSRDVVDRIVQFKAPGCAAYSDRTYQVNLEIPASMEVPNLDFCNLIESSYKLKIACIMPMFSENLHITARLCMASRQSVQNFFAHQAPAVARTMTDTDVDKSQFVLPLDQPIVSLEVTAAFNGLTNKQKLYAHYISQASWTGALITLLQTSPESGPIFVLLHKLFSGQTPKDFQAQAIEAGFSEDEVKALLVYTCGLFSNAGNYKGFGDAKFIPNIEADRLEALLKVSPVWPKLESLWNDVKSDLYDLSSGKTCLGYAPHGCTTYLSKNCSPDDNALVQHWLKSQQMECYNSRLFKVKGKTGKTTYEIRLASEEKGEVKRELIGNTTFCITKGDYSPIIGRVARYLEQAAQYAASDIQSEMLKAYAQSFITGSLDEHKRGSRFWIKDKGPSVESYIGFIETYRDPAGVRGEFEGFVAIVNHAMSEKFAVLVEHAEQFLPLLPWTRGFEKDQFLRPDFTSLDVLSFASSGIPAGINIPNYDDIRQTEGFKNVSLGNVIPATYQMSSTPFLSEADNELLQKYRLQSFELQVGLHELLGHGSGKLLRRETDGSLNYPSTLLDPLTGNPPASCYEPGDTYDSRFGPLSSSYEECRAEAVGLYLSLDPTVLGIFGHSGQQAEDVVYVNWLSLIWNGVGRSLETWDPKRGWLQAHAQARFVLARVLIQAGVVQVTQPSDDDLLVTLDRANLAGAGRNAIGNFLLQLQVYKATGNVEAAKELYQRYSEVSEPWLSWRAIVLANKQPRKIFTQANTIVKGDDVEIKSYEENLEGMIQSWVERFADPDPLYQALLELTAADKQHFI